MNLLSPAWWQSSGRNVSATLDDTASMFALKTNLFESELKTHISEAIRRIACWVAFALLVNGAAWFALLALIWLAWDTPYRGATIVGVPATLAIAACIAMFVARRMPGRGPLFPRSRAELARDREWMRQWMT